MAIHEPHEGPRETALEAAKERGEPLVKVKFLQDRTTKNRPQDQDTFKAGKTYELPASSAQHWINRGVAEEVESGRKSEAKPEPKGK